MNPVLQIGPHTIKGRVFLAPMAGVTDAPFRALCARFGAALTFSEMITSDVDLWQTEKTKTRLVWADNEPIRAIQLAGSDPKSLVYAAQVAVDAGATWIDINMGCPMKKVCRVWAGSALMSQPICVAEILTALVKNISVPITLKTRTGSNLENRNAVEIAHIAEDCGV
ncbi:MAG: tRNA-dihydrouridine synthase, partial [Pseudomonadota bacterium]